MSRPPRPRLRTWQQAALAAWRAHPSRDFLAAATPGAGKTTFALAAAAQAFADGRVEQLVVVCPSDHLRTQWADAAAAAGLPLDPQFTNADATTSPQFVGVVVTYAQVAAAPAVHDAGVRGAKTFVIFDEVHHAGEDRSWGQALAQAYAGAVYRLSLSGTPWRSDTAKIPWVAYTPDEAGQLVSACDYRYGYTQALAEQVVRPVMFMAYSGQARWSDNAGNELAAALDEPMPAPTLRQAWRTALHPDGAWIQAVLAAADVRLTALRAGGMPDAGGLVLASNQAHARAYARLLEQLTGAPAAVVTCDSPGASARLEAFAGSSQRWLVAVRMVSEGVDIPRLAVQVYATNVAAPLFFAQAVGRVVRARRAGESATVFLPSVPPLLALAAALELERDHVLPGPDGQLLDDAAVARANQLADLPEPGRGFVAHEASGHLDRVIIAGAEHGAAQLAGSAGERDWLALPGMLDVRELTRRPKPAAGPAVSADAVSVPLHRQVAAARRELHQLVGRAHHRTGASHGELHARLRAVTGGPVAAGATLGQLDRRIAAAQQWV